MDEGAARAALAALIVERREDYAALSRLLGRNAAYVQQYIKRGTPRRLDAGDVVTLARYFGIAPTLIGGEEPIDGALIAVPRLDIGASAGPGALVPGERRLASRGFDREWLRAIAPRAAPAALSMIRVEGDSMRPTLLDGDEILVDRGDAAESLRDGIYVIRAGEALIVKRLARHPEGTRFTVRSDNPAYPDWADYHPDRMAIIGRVMWAGRRLG